MAYCVILPLVLAKGGEHVGKVGVLNGIQTRDQPNKKEASRTSYTLVFGNALDRKNHSQTLCPYRPEFSCSGKSNI